MNSNIVRFKTSFHLWAICFILLSWINIVIPQQNSQFFPRQKITLDGEWEFKKKGDSEWRKIILPSYINDEAVLFFRRSFELPAESRNSQFVLTFEGISFFYQVKLNNQYIATQNDGFTPLIIVVDSDLLYFQETNQVEIEVDTRLSQSTIPLKQALFQPEPLRGIFRNVFLEILPAFAIFSIQNDINLSENLNEAAVVSNISFQISPDFFQQRVSSGPNQTPLNLNIKLSESQSPNLIILSLDKTISQVDFENRKMDVPFIVRNPKLWDTNNPILYLLDVTITSGGTVIENYKEKIGIRNIELRNHKIVLNNQPITIRGVTYIEEPQNRLMATNSLELLSSIKTLGFNTISWYTVPPEQAINITDSLGLFSFLPVPVWNIPGEILAKSVILGYGQNILQRIITFAQNHPSIFAVSLGHGYDSENNKSYDFIKSLRNRISSSPDFFITAGFRSFKNLDSQLPLDFITLDLTGRHSPGMEAWNNSWAVESPNQPVLFAGVSRSFMPTIEDEETISHFESQQAQTLKQDIKTITENSNLGYIIGNIYDWKGLHPTLLSPLTPQSQILPYGIADIYRTPRMAWNMMQNLHSKTQDQFTFNKPEGMEPKDNIFLFFGLGIIVLFLYYFRKDHRLRGNFIRILFRPFGFQTEIKDGRKISFSSSLVILLSVIFCWALIFSSLIYILRQNPLFDFFLAQISPFVQLHWVFIQMTLNPVAGLAGFILLFGLLMIFFAMLTTGLAKITNKSLSFQNALTFIGWESSVFIFLLPIALVFHRLLAISVLQFPLFLLLVLFFAWYVYRLYVGLKIIFSLRGWQSFVLVVLIPILAIFIILIIYDQNRALTAHSLYLFNIWNSGF